MHARTLAVSLIAALSFIATSGCSGDLDLNRGNRSFTELELRDQQRAFWVDHATWLHSYAISNIKDLDDVEVAYDRLLQGVTDYGNSFQGLYGRDAQPELTRLFRQHVAIENQIIEAVKAQDAQGYRELQDRYAANAQRLARALYQTNNNLAEADTIAMLNAHLNDVADLAVAIRSDAWENDVAVYDRMVDNVIKLADAQVVGYRASFPERVTVTLIVQRDGETVAAGSGTTDSNQEPDQNAGDELKLTEADINLHLAVRDVFSDHAMYEKFNILSNVEGLKGSVAFSNRLLGNADQIAAALQPYMNQGNAEQLARLMRQHNIFANQVLQSLIVLNAVQNNREIILNADGTITVDEATFTIDVNINADTSTTDSGGCQTQSTSASSAATTCPNQNTTSTKVTLTVQQRTRLINGLERRYEAAVARWQANGDAIATFLANVIPTLEEADMQAMFREHLEQIHEMMLTRIETRWADDVAAYDAMVEHVYELADTISTAIIQQRLNQSDDQDTGSTGNTGSCHQSACNSGY